MAEKVVRMWFDREADFLEVIFEQKPGYFRPTENDQVMEKVDQDGNVIGFSVLRVSSLTKTPLEVSVPTENSVQPMADVISPNESKTQTACGPA